MLGFVDCFKVVQVILDPLFAWIHHNISFVGAGDLPFVLVDVLHVAFLARAVPTRVHHFGSLILIEFFQTDKAIDFHS